MTLPVWMEGDGQPDCGEDVCDSLDDTTKRKKNII